jgi:hypothetical protein
MEKEHLIFYCVLEDCNREACHHCFPVKDCNLHPNCIKNGKFTDINIIKKQRVKKIDKQQISNVQ